MEVDLLCKAYDTARNAHADHRRDSGESYFDGHVRPVAIILAQMGIDDHELLKAALLHDVLEMSELVTGEHIRKLFGDRVARIVVAMTKPARDDPCFRTDKERVDFYRHQLIAGGWEVWVVKLADNLHNTRTLGACSEEKITRKLAETIQFYLPLIDRLASTHSEVAVRFRVAFQKAIADIEELLTT